MRRRQIFISYERGDVLIARRVRQALRGEGVQVWWDEKVQTGERWEERIDKELMSAEAILVLWSNSSIRSEWVKHEASIGKIRGVLTHALTDNCGVPAPFQAVQAANLSGWEEKEEHSEFIKLVRSIKAIRNRRILQGVKKLAVHVLVVLGSFLAGYFYSNPPETQQDAQQPSKLESKSPSIVTGHASFQPKLITLKIRKRWESPDKTAFFEVLNIVESGSKPEISIEFRDAGKRLMRRRVVANADFTISSTEGVHRFELLEIEYNRVVLREVTL